ncbi:MAG: hypothetical protein ILP12_02205 [Lachnospiraceae bacterium]|nr:hypothetical protein [Lachnospiraceae bacterium]
MKKIVLMSMCMLTASILLTGCVVKTSDHVTHKLEEINEHLKEIEIDDQRENEYYGKTSMESMINAESLNVTDEVDEKADTDADGIKTEPCTDADDVDLAPDDNIPVISWITEGRIREPSFVGMLWRVDSYEELINLSEGEMAETPGLTQLEENSLTAYLKGLPCVFQKDSFEESFVVGYQFVVPYYNIGISDLTVSEVVIQEGRLIVSLDINMYLDRGYNPVMKPVLVTVSHPNSAGPEIREYDYTINYYLDGKPLEQR